MNYSRIFRYAWDVTLRNRYLFWLGVIELLLLPLNPQYFTPIANILPWLKLPEVLTTTPNLVVEIQRFFTGTEYLPSSDVLLRSAVFYFISWGLNFFITPTILFGLKLYGEGTPVTIPTAFLKVIGKFKHLFLWEISISTIALLFTLFLGLPGTYPSSQGVVICRCLALPVTAIIGFFRILVPILIVFEDKGPISAFDRAWDGFIKPHGWKMVVLTILNGLVSFGITIGIIIVCLPLVGMLYFASSVESTNLFPSILLVLLYSPILTVVLGISRVFLNAVWVEAYDQMKAIDRAKEAAVAFDGELEMDINGDNMISPSDSLPSGE
jgi:hypothetical protein